MDAEAREWRRARSLHQPGPLSGADRYQLSIGAATVALLQAVSPISSRGATILNGTGVESRKPIVQGR
jgi:hypothetical protein